MAGEEYGFKLVLSWTIALNSKGVRSINRRPATSQAWVINQRFGESGLHSGNDEGECLRVTRWVLILLTPRHTVRMDDTLAPGYDCSR